MAFVTPSADPPTRWSASPTALRGLALTSLCANVVIVITGGAVRLTGSGLGCPTWPRCTEDSYVATAEMGIHGAIEFGNRALSVLVGVAAVAALLATLTARPRRPELVRLASGVLGMVILQGVVGGASVLWKLNPWVVGSHFTLSMIAIALAYLLWVRSREDDVPATPVVPQPLRWLVAVITVVGFAVLLVGTWVTGAGPHAGDPEAPRLQIDLTMIAQLHVDLVCALLGLTVAAWFAFRAVAAPPRATRAVVILLAIQLGQGVIGFVQYFTALPILLVGMHMAGACAVWLGVLHLQFATRRRVRATTEAAPAASPPVTPPRAERIGSRRDRARGIATSSSAERPP